MQRPPGYLLIEACDRHLCQDWDSKDSFRNLRCTCQLGIFASDDGHTWRIVSLRLYARSSIGAMPGLVEQGEAHVAAVGLRLGLGLLGGRGGGSGGSGGGGGGHGEGTRVLQHLLDLKRGRRHPGGV